MKITDNILIPPHIAAEMTKAADNAARGVRDPDRVKQARRSMDQIREEIRKTHGVLDIGAAAIRELRDE